MAIQSENCRLKPLNGATSKVLGVRQLFDGPFFIGDLGVTSGYAPSELIGREK